MPGGWRSSGICGRMATSRDEDAHELKKLQEQRLLCQGREVVGGRLAREREPETGDALLNDPLLAKDFLPQRQGEALARERAGTGGGAAGRAFRSAARTWFSGIWFSWYTWRW